MASRLHALAYKMLGSYAEAEEVVQEAEIKRLSFADDVRSEESLMTRIVVNLCVDRLRRLKLERQHYHGPWLPDVVAGDSVSSNSIMPKVRSSARARSSNTLSATTSGNQGP